MWSRAGVFQGLVALFSAACVLCSVDEAQSQELWPDLMKSEGPRYGGGEQDAAVVVGIEDYWKVSDVPGAVDNALAWERWLSRDRGVPLGRITVLTNGDGTNDRIVQALSEASGQVGRGGQLWFVFIGHGAPSSDGSDGLLVGADVQQTASSIYSRSVSREEVLRTIKGVPDAVLVLDTCFSGRGSDNRSIVEGLQPLVPVKDAGARRGVTVFTAAAGDQFAGPLPGARRPAFSYLLLGALRGWGDRNGDGEVSEQEAVDYATQNLRYLLAGSRAQTPELWSAESNRSLVSGRKLPGRKLEAGPDVSALAATLRRSGAVTPVVAPPSEELTPIQWGSGGGPTAIVEFNSAPTGATVLVDGKLLCQTTPCSKALPVGRHAVEVSGDCFVSHTQPLDVGTSDARLSPTLTPRLAGLEVSAQDDKGNDLVAEVLVDGARVGATPGRFEVGVCSRRLEVRKSGHTSFSTGLTLREREVSRVSAKLPSERSASLAGVSGMVKVPGGEFQRGTPSGGDGDERPAGRVYVSEFWIDKTEVTVDAYASCVKAGKCTAPDASTYYCSGSWSDRNNWLNRAERGSHPVHCVDWDQSVAFCSWSGKRLPTEAEWEKAARGVDGRKYPWGEEAASCQYAVIYEGDDGCGSGVTHPVGSRPRGASPYGALDMSGNVYEWVSDWYGSYSGVTGRDPRGASSGSRRVARGGSFYGVDASFLRAADRGSLAPGYVSATLGFRCARSD